MLPGYDQSVGTTVMYLKLVIGPLKAAYVLTATPNSVGSLLNQESDEPDQAWFMLLQGS